VSILAPLVALLVALTPAEERELERIATLGYVAGSVPAVDTTGVLVHDPDRTLPGLTLYTPAAGPEALLIDADGDLVHRWTAPGSAYWPRARLLPGGELLVITHDPARLMKIDRDSRVVWRYRKTAHHDLDIGPDGAIHVLVRRAINRDDIHDGAPILDDHIAVLDARGRELRSFSILEAFQGSDTYGTWLEDRGLPDGPDILHTNSIEVLTREGRPVALVSIRSVSTIALIDLKDGRLVWALDGPWRKQHEAQFVPQGILLFDNLGAGDTSRVLIVSPGTGEIVWQWSEPGFFSRGAGSVESLSNGNMLITESENGRIVEIAPDGEVVWEYLNPVTIDRGSEMVLGIMRAERIEGADPPAWAAP
jgi:hypothetical protein